MAAWNSSQPRIEALRARWDQDPSSRLSLQLAEEYRRSGELDQALHVLRKGIENTSSIAAEVALGRCLLEANDVAAAKVHLGRAIERDPTQMVAYRHLIEVHVGLGEQAEAESALEIYRQLNPTDPDLDGLKARVARTGVSPPADPEANRSSPRQAADGDQVGPDAPPPPSPRSPVETASFEPLGPQASEERAERTLDAPSAPEAPGPTFDLSEARAPTPETEASADADSDAPEAEAETGPPSTRSESRPTSPFVSFLDRTEDENVLERSDAPKQLEAIAPVQAEPEDTPSRFGFAGNWPEADVDREHTEPFFESEDPVFQAPQEGVEEHAVVVENGELFALEQVERDEFDLFKLPSRPLRRRRHSSAVSEVRSDPVRTATATLSRLYREQGHEEEADLLDRQAEGDRVPADEVVPALKVVDLAPLRQLRETRGVARRRLVVAAYLDRLTEARDVS